MIDEAQQRALARAARTHDHDDFALSDFKVDAAQHFARAVGLVHVAEDDEGVACGLSALDR